MKKRLIIVLSALLAVLLSLGLVACKETDDNTTSGDKVITAVAVTASPTIDENVTKDGWDKSGFTVKVTYKDGTTEDLTKVGEQFTLDDDDVAAIKFGTVGTYSVTIQPKENTPDFLTGTGAVVIDHVWTQKSETVNGNKIDFEECSKDGARRTIIEGFKTTVEVGGYWDSKDIVKAEENTKCPRIAPFPAVTLNGASTNVATATVGRLEEGMTISIRGKGIVTSEANTWYIPILGVAVPELGNGGTGGVIRNDGWLLYDGVGTGGCLTGPGTNGACPALSDMTDYSAWKDWDFYYEGTTSLTADYVTEQDLELSWRFTTIKDESEHEARIVEITFMNYTIGRSYIARIKIPDSIHAVQTIFHAEFFKMEITKATVIEMKSLKNINSVTATAGGKLAYVANEMFDFKALTVKADYKQEGNTAQAVSDYDFYGTAEEVANEAVAKALDEPKWVNLKYNKLQSNFKYYRVKLTIGETSDVKYYAPTTLGVSVKANAVNDANANTVSKDNGKTGDTPNAPTVFPESGLNAITFTQGTGVLPQLNVSGYAATITSQEQRKLLGNTTKNHYIAFSIYQDGVDDFAAKTPSVTGTEGYVAVRAFGGKHAVDVVLAVDSTVKTVTIKGVQDTDILVNLTDSGKTPALLIEALNATSSVTTNTLSLTTEGHVAITYKFGTTQITSANAANYRIGLGNAARALNYFFSAPGRVRGIGNLATQGNAITDAAGEYAQFKTIYGSDTNYAVRELGTGILAGISNADIKAGELTVHYVVTPDVAAPKSYVAHFDTRADENSEFVYAARDTIYPALLAPNTVYATASGMQVYLLYTGATPDLQSGNIRGNMSVTINNGAGIANLADEYQTYDYLQEQDLSFAVANGVATLTNTSLPANLAGVTLFPFGTVDNVKDTDYGYALVVAVDVTQLGYAKGTAYCFRVNGTGDIMTVNAEGAVSKLEGAKVGTVGADRLGQETCVDSAIMYTTYTKDSKVVYWDIVGLTELKQHEWKTTAEADGTYKCNNCPSIKRVFTESGVTRTLIETPAKTRVANTDYSDVWWEQGEGGSAVGTHVFRGDFIVQYTFKNTRDKDWHQDVVIELINGADRYYDLNFAANNPWGGKWADAAADGKKEPFDNGKNGSNTMTATKNGTAIAADAFAAEFEQGEKATAAGKWEGDYTLTIFRVGDTYTIIQKIVNKSKETYVVTNTVTIKQNDKLLVSPNTTVQFVGNPFWVDDIRVSYGTAETVTTATATKTTITTGNIYYYNEAHVYGLMEFGKTNNSTGYTGDSPLWTMTLKPGMKVVVGGDHTSTGANAWNSVLGYLTKQINYRADNWINGMTVDCVDTGNIPNSNADLRVDRHWKGMFEVDKDGAWVTSGDDSVNKFNGDWVAAWRKVSTKSYATITWDWTDKNQIVVYYTFEGTIDGVAARFEQGYVTYATTGKSLANEYLIGIGVDGAWFKADSLTIIEPVSAT